MNSKRHHGMAILYATATAFIWGLSFLSIKVAVVVLPPMTLGLARFIIAGIVLALLFVFMKKSFRMALRDIPRMAAAGIVGVTIYFLGENNGVLLLSASEASIIVGTIPVVTMLVERVVSRSRLTLAQYAGAAISAAGVTVMVAQSLRLSSQPLGYLYMGMAAMSWVLYAFLTKPLLAKYDSLSVTFWQSMFGAAGFVPFALFERWDPAGLTPLVIVNILYLGIFCSAIGYLLYVASLKALGAGVSSVFINLIPVVSVAAAYILFGERLDAYQLGGGALAVAGVYLASLAGSGKQARGA